MSQKAVTNGIINYLSASQISKFDPNQEGGCNRRWYFDKVLGINEPGTKSQAIGTEVHSQLERYLKTGEKVLGSIALAGFDFLPQPGSVEVEHALQGFKIAGVPLKGFIDALNESPTFIDEPGLSQPLDNCTEIIDWKTASIIKGKGPGAHLINTIQMPIYGHYAATRRPLDFVRLSHVYFQTKGAAKASKKTALFSVDKIEQRYQDISQTVETMKDAAKVQAVEELPANMNACHAFHKECVYARHCPRNQKQIFDLHFGASTGETTMGLFDDVVKAPSNPTSSPVLNGTPKETAKEILATPAINSPSQRDFEAEIEALEQRKIQEKIKEIEAEERRALDAFGVDANITFQSIVPPDAKPSEGPGTFDPLPTEKTPAAPKTLAKKTKETPTEAPKVEIIPHVNGYATSAEIKEVTAALQGKIDNRCAEFPAFTPPVTPKDSRVFDPADLKNTYCNICKNEPVSFHSDRVCTICKNKILTLASKAFTPPTKPAEPSVASFVGPKEGLLSEDKFQEFQSRVYTDTPYSIDHLELYINVSVSGLETQDLQPIINRALKQIESDYGVKDIRLGKDALAYGGWKGVLASEIKSYNLVGRWSIRGQGDFTGVVIEALKTQAVTVVEAL